MRLNRPILFLAACLIDFSCSTSRAVERFDDWRPITEVDRGAVENPVMNIHHAVILYDGTIIDDRDGENTYISEYTRVRVFDSTGIEHLRTIHLPQPASMRDLRVKARTVKADGSVLELDGKDFYEKTLLQIGKRRMKEKVFAFKGVEPGDILEYYWSARYDQITPLIARFRSRYYKTEASLKWWYCPRPEGLALQNLTTDQLDHAVFGPQRIMMNSGSSIVEEKILPTAEDPKCVSEAIHNIPSFPEEPFAPDPNATGFLFAGFYEWPRLEAKRPYWDRVAKGFGATTREFLNRGNKRLSGWMKDLIADTRDPDRDLSGSLALIHRDIRNADLLQDDQLPEKLPKIESVDDLIEKRIGDTNTINMLLTAMLEKLGYDAVVFWARDCTDGPFIREWKTIRQFTLTGVAVKRGSDVIWCFPALPAVEAGSVPWQFGGTTAFMEDPTDEHHYGPFPALVEIPMVKPESNGRDLDVRLRITEDGAAAGRLTAICRCANDPFLVQRIHDLAPRDRTEALRILRGVVLRSGVPWKAEAESLRIDGMNIAYSCSIRVEGIVEDAGGMKLCDLGSLRSDGYSFPDKPREFPIDFQCPGRMTSRVSLAIPDGFAVADLPEPFRRVQPFAECRTGWSTDAGFLTLERDLLIPHAMYKSTAADAFRTFFMELYASTAQPVVLKERGE